MKQQVAVAELLTQFTLSSADVAFVKNFHTAANQLACAVLLKCYERRGRFPQRNSDIPQIIVEHLALQLKLSPKVFNSYQWQKGIIGWN